MFLSNNAPVLCLDKCIYFQFYSTFLEWSDSLLTKRYAVLRLETLSCDRKVGGKSNSQRRSSVSSNCNSDSRPRATESVYSLAKNVGQLDEVTAVRKH